MVGAGLAFLHLLYGPAPTRDVVDHDVVDDYDDAYDDVGDVVDDDG